MSQGVAEPNTDLAILLLAAGHDEKALRLHAGFATIRAARDFASRSETKAEVERAVEARRRRIGNKSLAALEQIIDSESTTGRDRIAAVRTGLEVAGRLGRDVRSSEPKLPRDLSAVELGVMIEATRAELQERIERYNADSAQRALIAPT